jgi:hypothetical protein
MEGIYHGRLVADGEGNLLASSDDPEVDGQPVAYHEGSYVFLSAGEDSHNKRHEQQVLPMSSTVDMSMTDDSDLVNAYEGGENAHHFGEEASGEKNPDAVAAKITGHTDAWEAN